MHQVKMNERNQIKWQVIDIYPPFYCCFSKVETSELCRYKVYDQNDKEMGAIIMNNITKEMTNAFLWNPEIIKKVKGMGLLGRTGGCSGLNSDDFLGMIKQP